MLVNNSYDQGLSSVLTSVQKEFLSLIFFVDPYDLT